MPNYDQLVTDEVVNCWWDAKTDTWHRADGKPACQDHLHPVDTCPFHKGRAGRAGK